MSARNKIPSENGNYYKRHWLELRDGGSDEWLYICQDAGDAEHISGWRFFFIELIDMPAACGSDAQNRWACQVDIVDLLEASAETMADALRSCGIDNTCELPNQTTLQGRLELAEMMRDYGAKSPMWCESGGKIKFDAHGNPDDGSYDENCPAFRRLRKEAREFVEQNLFDHESCEHILDTKIVNKIGQTAREFAQGTAGLWSSLRRIKAQGDEATPEQKLILGMYAKCEHTLGAGPIPEDIRKGDDGA